ncbi:MAG: NAD(P)-dependent oxidoreductase [Saprospiraceae bacterium]|nr:NAD(P)-dependent oxidoreductase [Saprospiraceae bacterium]
MVTGADGMLGSNIVQELISRKYEVTVFVLPNSPTLFSNLSLNRIEGNILELEGLKKRGERT